MRFQASNCVAFLLSVADGMYIQEIIAALPSDLKVVDLSADFRLRNTDTYEEWYNGPHRAPELQVELCSH
jgi:N-acetyl-gamma-glutamylphosphate reductase